MIFNLVWLPARQTGSSTRTKVLLRIMLRDTTVCEDDLVKQALSEMDPGFETGGYARRVLSSQWQGEFCRCSIDVVGGKQRDGGVDHLECFRHHTSPSPKAGKPMT